MGRTSKTIIPVAPIEHIMKNAGAGRVGKAGAEALTRHLVYETERVTKLAVEYATHAGRTTVHEGDVLLAIKHSA